jgi:alkanesulfonate monooxygenase SsuD/methylene tetrahydromethanopterin reductase-like flavin-dependent oxidoreductase (luciferase family)
VRAASDTAAAMTDYGHKVTFGVMLGAQGDPRDVVGLAELSESVGLDIVCLPDHPYWPERFETFTLLTAIAARTNSIRVMSNLANLPLRPPPMLARAAATLDMLTDGRFDLGIGTGAQQMWDSIVAEGGPRRSAGESIAALDEAIRIIRALWIVGPDLDFDGQHYRLNGVTRGPVPKHAIGIWLGAYQPRLLRLLGATADGWVFTSLFFPPEHIAKANQIIDAAARDAERSPSVVRRIYNVAGEFSATGTGFLKGPSHVWIEQLTELTLTEGISSYVLFDCQSSDSIRKFADEVAPAVREAVTTERTR